MRYRNEVQTFANWGDYLDFVGKTPLRAQYNASRRAEYGYDWNGTRNFDEAMKLAREGWPAGTDRAAKMAKPLFDKVAVRIERQEPVMDVEGMSLDIAAYLSEDPEPYLRFETENVEGDGHRLIRVVFNCSSSAGISKEVMEAKGATIAALVELLEFAGHRVEVVNIPFAAGLTYHWGDNKSKQTADWYCSVILKTYDQPLDMSRLMFALGHASNLRRLGFSALEHTSVECQQAFGMAYGYPADVDAEAEFGKCDLYISSSALHEVQWQNDDKAQEWVIEQLKKNGVKIS